MRYRQKYYAPASQRSVLNGCGQRAGGPRQLRKVAVQTPPAKALNSSQHTVHVQKDGIVTYKTPKSLLSPSNVLRTEVTGGVVRLPRKTLLRAAFFLGKMGDPP